MLRLITVKHSANAPGSRIETEMALQPNSRTTSMFEMQKQQIATIGMKDMQEIT